MNYILHSGRYVLLSIVLVSIISIIYKNIFIILIYTAFLLYFFRSAGHIPNKPNSFISPCQGTILKINNNSNGVYISIFLSILDTHVQYTPTKCTLISQKYRKGTFNPAYILEKSKHNEQMINTFYSNIWGKFTITQIAGIVARKIVSLSSSGDILEQGKPFGLIRFGSRIDIQIPFLHHTLIKCKQGDKINIGDDILKLL